MTSAIRVVLAPLELLPQLLVEGLPVEQAGQRIDARLVVRLLVEVRVFDRDRRHRLHRFEEGDVVEGVTALFGLGGEQQNAHEVAVALERHDALDVHVRQHLLLRLPHRFIEHAALKVPEHQAAVVLLEPLDAGVGRLEGKGFHVERAGRIGGAVGLAAAVLEADVDLLDRDGVLDHLDQLAQDLVEVEALGRAQAELLEVLRAHLRIPYEEVVHHPIEELVGGEDDPREEDSR